MKRIVTTAGLAALLVVGPLVASASASQPSMATGGVKYLNTAGQLLDLQFVARGTPSDADGQIGFRNPVTGVSFTADVDCYFQVGNQAQFSGQVVKGDLPAGTNIRVIAVDGGTPGSDGDFIRITRRPAENAPFDCTRPNTADRSVEDGNIVVHGADTATATAAALVAEDTSADVDM